MFKLHPQHHRSRRAIAVAASAAAAAAIIPISIASAASPTRAAAPQHSAARHTAPATAKPTIVLVHGAWANSSSWNGVIKHLICAGYTVRAAPNPLRGLSYDAAYLRDFLSSISGPIVLVGHSYGGAVITDAATGNKNVKALVYDDAYIPDQGEDISTLSTAQSALAPAESNPKSVFDVVGYPNPPAANVADTYLLRKVVFQSFAPDVSRTRAELLNATQSPTSLAALKEPSSAPAWKTIPSWDVVGRQDKIIPVAAQLSMAHRAGSHITQIDSSHVSLVSHPLAVARVILAAARATD